VFGFQNCSYIFFNEVMVESSKQKKKENEKLQAINANGLAGRRQCLLPTSVVTEGNNKKTQKALRLTACYVQLLASLSCSLFSASNVVDGARQQLKSREERVFQVGILRQ
jgi:hypothetical protein